MNLSLGINITLRLISSGVPSTNAWLQYGQTMKNVILLSPSRIPIAALPETCYVS